MKNIFVLFGKPGAGKGTRLSEFLNGREDHFQVLSVGNLLRKARKEQTELGKKAESYMDAGLLLPDEIINEIIIEAINTSEKDIILDGSPRTVVQAMLLLEAGIYPKKVINFEVDDETVIERTKHRIVCESCGESYTTNEFKPPKIEGICDKCGGVLTRRKDDEEKVVRSRLQVYQNQTYPVLKVFEDNSIRIIAIDNTQDDAGEQFAKVMSE